MIYHAFSSIPKDSNKPFTYWAIHGPTLTPVRVNVGPGGRVTLNIIPFTDTAAPVFMKHPESRPYPAAIAESIMASLQQGNPRLTHKATRTFTRDQVQVPEYLIVSRIDGTHPAIARTQDPHFVIDINERDQMLHTEHNFWRTTTDLSAQGWCYWWQDANTAYENLAPAFIAAAHAS